MSGGFAPRFVLEAGFLVLLAVAAGFADLRPLIIIAVMAGGWVLVSAIELLAWRSEARVSASLAQRVVEPEEEPEPAPDSWDIEEILAPLPEPDEDDEGHTRVLPPSEGQEGEAQAR
jgi:hypothetical protein